MTTMVVLRAGKELVFFQVVNHEVPKRTMRERAGGGMRRLLLPSDGGQGGPVLGGHGADQPALLQHHVRLRRARATGATDGARYPVVRGAHQAGLAGEAGRIFSSN
ncbi:hypothetical protein ZWY2020_015572 [Hordeum vulgare]|nr:hypothetical protein ZWY2020_015572 [Hordeum vulgare]